jgi:hypothetical protein
MMEFIMDMWSDGWVGKLLALLLVTISVIMLGFIGYGIFYLIDTVGRPKYTKICVVTSKGFTPAHTTTQMITITSGKTTTIVPQTIHHPDEWRVCVEFTSGWGDGTSVHHDFYDKVDVGDEIDGTFKVGRLSKSCHLVSLRK